MTFRRLSLVSLVSLLGILTTTAATAQTREDPEPEVSTPAPDEWERALAVSATLGWDTPYGIAGAALELTPFRYLAIYAGGGIGREGGRFTAGIRPQFPMGNMAMGILLGVAGGPMDWDSQGDERTTTRRHWEMALFLHSGLSMEYRWTSGLFGRLAFGAEALVTPSEPTSCSFSDGNECNAAAGSWQVPFRGWAGLTLGYAIDL